MKRMTILLLTLQFITTVSLSADSDLLSFDQMTSFLSSSEREALLSEGELTRFHSGSFDTELLPPVTSASDIKTLTTEGGLNMGIEGLFLYSDFDTDAFEADPAGMLLKMYNILRSVSSLEGTRYYSASRGEMRDLFVESWMIPDLDSPKTRLDDPLVDTIPAEESIFIHQRDKSFGRHESSMDYHYDAPVIRATIINRTPMFYKGFLKAVNPENMQIHLVIVPTEKGLLFYGISAADTINVKAFRERANNSFYNRVKAMYGWYISKL
ncbi:MAG: hypothetical protein PQJ58_13500 [Spirochaetales bacterium]|nr:hypothetical protein [Spirochaetales bacterium]